MEGTKTLAWQRACALDELQPNQGFSVKLGAERVALFRLGADVFAVRDRCPHQGSLLSNGGAYEQPGGAPIVVCPVHYWSFSLVDGRCEHHPSMQATVFRAEIRGYEVWVELPCATDLRVETDGATAQGK